MIFPSTDVLTNGYNSRLILSVWDSSEGNLEEGDLLIKQLYSTEYKNLTLLQRSP